jgi:hypothetical protein
LGGCHHKTAGDPDRGAKGNLLYRLGAAQFPDQSGNVTYAESDYTSMVAALTSSSRSVILSRTNMMGLGFLEVAVKDIVNFNYSTTETITIYDINGANPLNYPKIRAQANTGVNRSDGTHIPRQFENTASAVIDLGPLYDCAIQNGSYLNAAPALAYWNNTHHMSWEFLVALRYYARYHNYVAKALEQYFWASDSWSGGLDSSVSGAAEIGNFNSVWVFNQAKRSTIRFSQALVEQTALQLLLDTSGNVARPELAFWQSTFDSWFRRDSNESAPGYSGLVFYHWTHNDNHRQHQEFSDGVPRAKFQHYLMSGLDFLLSLRNPNLNRTYADMVSNWDTAGCDNIRTSDLAYDILTLQYTPLRRFGGRIDPSYARDLKLQLYRSREIGLDTYSATVAHLTNTPSVSDLNATQLAANVYHQAHEEKNSSRQYRSALASVVMAALAPINDVLVTDRSGYWGVDANGKWTADLYHPDPAVFDTFPQYQFRNCFPGEDQWGYGCNPISLNAAPVVVGYHPEIDVYIDECAMEENPYYFRGFGALFPKPKDMEYSNSDVTEPLSTWPNFESRIQMMFPLLNEFLNAMYYKYDGLTSLAVKVPAGPSKYLPPQLVDAFPSNIAWNYYHAYEGDCHTGRVDSSMTLSNACFRPSTCSQYLCTFDWAYPGNWTAEIRP